MPKKRVRIRTRILKLIFIILFFVIVYVVYFNIIGDDIKNIYINGNTILTEKEILEISGLDQYPSFLKTTKFSIEKKLKSNMFVENVNVKKEINKIITITIKEYKILFKDSNNNKYVLSSGKSYSLKKEYDTPLLLNYVSDEIYKKFVVAMVKLNIDIIKKISEIKYSPNDYDDDLFIFYMNDQNLVQITTSKIEKLNKYNEVIAELNGEKGILYLDSGNYFKIMK